MASDDELAERLEADQQVGVARKVAQRSGLIMVRRKTHYGLVIGMILSYIFNAIIFWALVSIVTNFHNQALHDRRDIACTFVQPYPNTEPGIKALRLKYDCPPYGPQPSITP